MSISAKLNGYLDFFNYSQQLVPDSVYSTAQSTKNEGETEAIQHFRFPSTPELMGATYVNANETTLKQIGLPNDQADPVSYQFSRVDDIKRKS